MTERLTKVCDLPDHGVKCKTHKTADGDSVASCFGVEYLRGNDPGEGATAHGEGELKDPTKHEKRPQEGDLC